MTAATVSSGRACIEMEDPVSSPSRPWASPPREGYRMPKVYWFSERELYLTFQLGRDHYRDQGLPTPSMSRATAAT